MKIAREIPQANEITHLKLTQNGLIPLKEPKSLISAILLSFPLMIVAGGLAGFVIKMSGGLSLKDLGLSGDSFTFTINLGVVFSILLLVVIHELIHLVFIPNFANSEKTAIGLTFWGGFVVSEEEISRARYIIITLAPYVILSLILPLVLGFLGLMTATLKWLILLNAMASSVDLLNLLIIFKQVPQTATMINNGSRTYWK